MIKWLERNSRFISKIIWLIESRFQSNQLSCTEKWPFFKNLFGGEEKVDLRLNQFNRQNSSLIESSAGIQVILIRLLNTYHNGFGFHYFLVQTSFKRLLRNNSCPIDQKLQYVLALIDFSFVRIFFTISNIQLNEHNISFNIYSHSHQVLQIGLNNNKKN